MDINASNDRIVAIIAQTDIIIRTQFNICGGKQFVHDLGHIHDALKIPIEFSFQGSCGVSGFFVDMMNGLCRGCLILYFNLLISNSIWPTMKKKNHHEFSIYYCSHCNISIIVDNMYQWGRGDCPYFTNADYCDVCECRFIETINDNGKRIHVDSHIYNGKIPKIRPEPFDIILENGRVIHK